MRPEPAGGDGEEGGERGLQAERTELAWIRTALACGGLTLLTGRLGGDAVPAPVAYALGAAVAATGLAAALVRIGALRRAAGGPWRSPPPLPPAGASPEPAPAARRPSSSSPSSPSSSSSPPPSSSSPSSSPSSSSPSSSPPAEPPRLAVGLLAASVAAADLVALALLAA